MLNTDKAWQKWGRDDPYFGVLADDRFTRHEIAGSRDAFFRTGEATVGAVLKKIEHHFGPLGRNCALDHGCGVGRLTLPLARRFDSVVALDVAPAMLAEAARNAAAGRVGNIQFALADDWASEARGLFDFVNSHLVLQHVPVDRGLRIIDALADRLAPGGGLHLTVSHRIDRGGRRLLYWASANVPGVKVWQNLCAGRAWNAPAMQMNHYPVGTILARLARRGITDVLVVTHVEERFVTCSLLGRKPV